MIKFNKFFNITTFIKNGNITTRIYLNVEPMKSRGFIYILSGTTSKIINLDSGEIREGDVINKIELLENAKIHFEKYKKSI